MEVDPRLDARILSRLRSQCLCGDLQSFDAFECVYVHKRRDERSIRRIAVKRCEASFSCRGKPEHY